jgi:hypothetical protein
VAVSAYAAQDACEVWLHLLEIVGNRAVLF